ncbi:MAG: ABC transporter ATP-binding protein [Chloroflexota bacterium]
MAGARPVPLLELVAVTHVFRTGLFTRRQPTPALADFSFALPSDRATLVTIAGESGSGKTTAARLALGLLRPTSGSVRYRGVDLRAMSRSEAATFRREVQAIFQDPYEVYNPFYRVDHVFDLLLSHFRLARTRDEGRRLVEEALTIVGLDPGRTLGRYPHQLSGGQRQRIMVARAFLVKPRLIVADEPVSMVDASLRASILESMLRLKDDYGISFLYITHDLSTAYHVSDEILVLYRGRVVERGPTRAVIDAPTHPYTRLLIDSIPVPDPDVRWPGRVDMEQLEALEAQAAAQGLERREIGPT